MKCGSKMMDGTSFVEVVSQLTTNDICKAVKGEIMEYDIDIIMLLQDF